MTHDKFIDLMLGLGEVVVFLVIIFVALGLFGRLISKD